MLDLRVTQNDMSNILALLFDGGYKNWYVFHICIFDDSISFHLRNCLEIGQSERH